MNRTRSHRCRGGLLALAFLAAGCDGTSPREKAAQDARAVAQVEAVQEMKPPLQPLHLQPIDPAARKLFELPRTGCAFFADALGDDRPVLIGAGARAVLLIDGHPAIFAADSGSPELAAGFHETYVGRTHSVRVTRAPDSLTIRDRFERIAYRAPGRLDCAVPPSR